MPPFMGAWVFSENRLALGPPISMAFHSRRLPHWQPEDVPLFITWRLHGTLPRNRFPPPGASAGQAFVWMDRYLDQAKLRSYLAQARGYCPNDLRLPATTPLTSLRQFDLHAAVVMPNHVHVLLTPIVAPSQVAAVGQRLLGPGGESDPRANGRAFLASRNLMITGYATTEEFGRICAYIEENPVRAGLAASAQDFRWSSAYDGRKAVVAG